MLEFLESTLTIRRLIDKYKLFVDINITEKGVDFVFSGDGVAKMSEQDLENLTTALKKALEFMEKHPELFPKEDNNINFFSC